MIKPQLATDTPRGQRPLRLATARELTPFSRTRGCDQLCLAWRDQHQPRRRDLRALPPARKQRCAGHNSSASTAIIGPASSAQQAQRRACENSASASGSSKFPRIMMHPESQHSLYQGYSGVPVVREAKQKQGIYPSLHCYSESVCSLS